MSVEVEIVGGPRDGQVFAVEGLGRTIGIAELASPLKALTMQESGPTMADVSTWSLPIRLTPNGYRAYWGERQ